LDKRLVYDLRAAELAAVISDLVIIVYVSGGVCNEDNVGGRLEELSKILGGERVVIPCHGGLPSNTPLLSSNSCSGASGTLAFRRMALCISID